MIGAVLVKNIARTGRAIFAIAIFMSIFSCDTNDFYKRFYSGNLRGTNNSGDKTKNSRPVYQLKPRYQQVQPIYQPIPTQRRYNNPYVIPAYAPSDHDYYYQPPQNYKNVEPDQTMNNIGSSAVNQKP